VTTDFFKERLHCVHINLQDLVIVRFVFNNPRIAAEVIVVGSTARLTNLELLAKVAILNLELIRCLVTAATRLDPATELLSLVSNFLLGKDCEDVAIDRSDLLVRHGTY
jgi:uncharacterized protein with PhoU and TrkA domain